jgi:hypothetical protein
MVAMMLVASIASVYIANAVAANNHLDYNGTCPLEGDYPCHVSFGDGSSLDVVQGPFSLGHDYGYTPGGLTVYTVELSNRLTGEVIESFDFAIDDRPAQVEAPQEQVHQSSAPGYQSWQCSVSFNQTGNRLDIRGTWMGEGHPFIMVDAGNGVTFGMPVGFDGTFGDATSYDLGNPGIFQVRTWIDGTDQGCGNTAITIGQPASVSESPATCSFVPHQAGDLISVHPRHCNWYAFLRSGELWYATADGGEWQIVGQLSGEPLQASSVTVEPSGAITYIGSDGRNYITDRAGTGPGIR